MMFEVEIADATGHSVVQMTQKELSQKAEAAEDTWVSVNDQMVEVGDLETMDLTETSRIRLMPGLVGGRDMPTFVVQIADATGHSEVTMTQDELALRAEQATDTWVFVNDQLVSAAELAGMALDADSRVRMVPGLVGGSLRF